MGLPSSVVMAVFLVGCSQVADGSPSGPMPRVEHEWLASGLPDPRGCLETVPIFRHGDEASYFERCPDTTDGIEGCWRREDDGHAWMYLHPDHNHDAATMQHLALHIIYACIYGGQDLGHSDARVWIATGGDLSIQAKAR